MSSTTIRVLIDGKGSISGLDTVNRGLKGVQDQAKQTRDTVQKAVKFDFTASVPGLKSLQSVVGGVGSAWSAATSVIGGGLVGAAVIRGISSAIDESLKLENALLGVESVAKSFGQNTDEVKKAVLDFTKDGLVPASDAALAFKQILSTGTDLPTAIKLMNSLKDAAALNRQSFYSLGEAIVATTEGIKNGTSARADAVGITTNLSQMDAYYAAQLGKTAGALTDVEKYQARVNGFIREGAIYAGDAAKVLDTYTGASSRLGTSFDRLLAGMGGLITKSQGLKAVMGGLSSVFDAISERLNKTPLEKLKERYAELGEQVKNESGFYKQYAIQNQAAVKKQIDAIESQIAKEKELAKLDQEKAKSKLAGQRASEENNKVAAQAAKDRLKEIKALDKALKTAGETELQTLQRIREERLKLVGPKDIERRTRIEQDFAKKVNELNQKNHDEQVKRANELAKLNKRLTEEAITKGANNIFSPYAIPEGLTPEQQDKYKRNNDLGRGVGALNSVVGGKEGAKALVSSAAAAGLDALAQGLGQAAKPLLDAFTEGPDAVKKMVNEFSDALPDVIIGFVEAIPVFIETLVDRAPDIIQRLVEKAPAIITKLIADAPRIITKVMLLMPKLAIQFIKSLIQNAPMLISEIARGIYDAISNALSGGGAFGSGGGVSGFFEDANSWSKENLGFGFASGGEIPRMTGTPFKDSVPATLMPGERVLDLETNRAFKEMVRNGGADSNIQALLVRVINLLEQPVQVMSSVKVNQREFAQIMLELNRTQQRIS